MIFQQNKKKLFEKQNLPALNINNPVYSYSGAPIQYCMCVLYAIGALLVRAVSTKLRTFETQENLGLVIVLMFIYLVPG